MLKRKIRSTTERKIFTPHSRQNAGIGKIVTAGYLCGKIQSPAGCTTAEKRSMEQVEKDEWNNITGVLKRGNGQPGRTSQRTVLELRRAIFISSSVTPSLSASVLLQKRLGALYVTCYTKCASGLRQTVRTISGAQGIKGNGKVKRDGDRSEAGKYR